MNANGRNSHHYKHHNNTQMNNEKILNSTDYLILFILAGLTFCIAFGMSAPSLFINDEWITVNQVNQLTSGTQLVENEGKYGRSIEGETSAYFIARDNYLAYSIFLPIISLPVMHFIIWAGDQFRLFLLTFWFITGMCSLIVGIWLLSRFSEKKYTYLGGVILILFFSIFLLNIYYYQPFMASFLDSPIESAAVIFSNEILFAMITPMLYVLFRNVSLSRWTSLANSLIVICCSTYLFWSASAKDHILVAFILTSIIFFFSSTLSNQKGYKWFTLFMLTGLLCWSRPEFGFFILTGLIIWYLFSFISTKSGRIVIKLDNLKNKFLAVPGCVIGLCPFFLNNFLVTGNPIIPPQYLYVISGKNSAISAIALDTEYSTSFLTKIFSYLEQVFLFFSPNIENIVIDGLGILFSPVNNGVGILFICPIILPALLYGLLNFRSYKMKYPVPIRQMLIFSALISVLTVIAYLRVIHGSTVSPGILPDMRYFSPLYLPMGIISVLLLSPIISVKPERWLKYILLSVVVFAPILVIGTIVALPHGVTYNMYVHFFMRILLILLLVLFGLAAFNKKFWSSDGIFPIIFSFLLMIPSAFQFLHLIIYSIGKSNGYYFWLPVLEYLFSHVFSIIQ